MTCGTYYIRFLLINYKGNKIEIYISWFLLCIIVSYNLYSLYYESLLLGRGLVKRSKQIIIIGHLTYLLFAIFFLMRGYGLIALVSAQALYIFIIRILSYKFFYTKDLKQFLLIATGYSRKDILKVIYPNATKLGLTLLGGFVVARSSIVIGSLFISLEQIASYGITIQIINIISTIAATYTLTFIPQISHNSIQNNFKNTKKIYITGQLVLILIYVSGGLFLLVFGNWSLSIIKSDTQLLSRFMIAVALIIAFLEKNHSVAASILALIKNEIPFFKASLLSGFVTILLLLLLLNYTNFGLWSLLLAPGIAQLSYQNWKWPLTVKNELRIKIIDYWILLKRYNRMFKTIKVINE